MMTKRFKPCLSWASNPKELLMQDSSPLKTCISALDEVFDGGCRNEMIVVAGMPGFGKTDLAINLAIAFLLQNRPVFYLSVELSREQILRRSLCTLANRIDVSIEANEKSILQLFETTPSNKLLNDAYKLISSKYIIIDESFNQGEPIPPHTVEEIKHSLQKWKAEQESTPCLVVDYIQQLYLGDYQGTTTTALDRVSKELAKIAHIEHTPVVVLSSLSKTDEIRGSSQIEHDADKLIIIKPLDGVTREEMLSSDIRSVKLMIKKNRTGKAGIAIEAIYHPDQHLFI